MLLAKYFMLFNMPVYYYGIISALGYLTGVVVCCINAKKRGFSFDDIVTCACYVIPLAIVGARLCFVIFNISHYNSFWEIFNLRDGGLVFYGGLIGGILGVVLYCVIHKKSFLKFVDIAVCGLILGQGIGRWGNFINQEAHGFEVTNPAFQFFPICVSIGSKFYLATFFYEFVNNLIIFIVLEILLYKVNFKNDGMIAHIYLIAYGACRFIVEGLRVDCVMLGVLKFSQVTSILLIAYGLSYIIAMIVKNKKEKTSKKTKDSFDIILDVLKTKI